MSLQAAALVLGGLVFLAAGGEVLLRGATRLATLLGVSPLVIGLTVVAFGTSAPELAVSVMAAIRGAPEVALGNVVGSTTFNVLGILGLTAIVAPLVVASRLVRIDVPLMAFAAVLALVLSIDGRLDRLDGFFLTGGLATYMVFCIVEARRGDAAAVEHEMADGVARRSRGVRRLAAAAILVVAGLAVLVVGSRWLVEGSVSVARSFGVSELVIGLTIVAAGTSLPEVAASVAAAVRGQRDIAVANVVGSNLFNLLGVLGISALVAGRPLPVPQAALRFDMPIMLAACLACLPIFLNGFRIRRWEGALLLAYYAAYVLFLVLHARASPSADLLSKAMVGFVMPLTIVTAAVVFVRAALRPSPR